MRSLAAELADQDKPDENNQELKQGNLAEVQGTRKLSEQKYGHCTADTS